MKQKRVLSLRAMAIGATDPDYDATAQQWSRARDVLAGERYLPRLDSQSEEEYSAYKARASFFGATARTWEEYLDMVFRRVAHRFDCQAQCNDGSSPTKVGSGSCPSHQGPHFVLHSFQKDRVSFWNTHTQFVSC